MRTLVIVPTYDEAENIAWIVERVRTAQPEVDVLVVDDASPDGTGQIADALAEQDHHVHVMHRTRKNGLGGAYLAGFEWGLERGFELLVEMDADGSHLPEQLHRLLDAAEDGADLVIGSRWIPGGQVENWGWHRRLISRGGTQYARIMLGLPVHDATAGYRVYRSTALEALHLELVASQGYCFQIDMTRRAAAAGQSIVEVPITFVERVRGHSKMSSSIVREALWRVTGWGLRRRLHLKPARRERVAAPHGARPLSRR
mgnify:CR=1 FL=1